MKAIAAPKISAVAVAAIAFAVRLAYMLHSHPFVDEFTSVLAAKSILQKGLPVLPSGLFYEHGLLFSYLIAPWVAFAGTDALFIWARLPSVLVGVLAVLAVYKIGARWFSPGVGLAAALIFAISPEGMVWGGRARMYALAQLLVLLMTFFAFEGGKPRGKSGMRWIFPVVTLLALLAQFGTLMFLPPILVGVLILRRRELSWRHIRWQTLQPWLWQALALGGVVGIGMLIKRLGQPLGMAQLNPDSLQNPVQELWRTLAYQLRVTFNGESTVQFLARLFGVPHHIWLTGIALLGGGIALARRKCTPAYLFLWTAFGLTVVEMVTLLAPFRRNPRYLVMGLPLFYLLAAHSGKITLIAVTPMFRRYRRIAGAMLVTGFALLFLFGWWQSITVAYRTPEPPYNQAFQFVRAHRQPDDVLLTPLPAAAALYLPRVDYFAQQKDADQFLLNRDTAPVDRWLGAPWVGSVTAFNEILNTHTTVWFVADTQRLTTFGYYGGDWLATLKTQMTEVWSHDGAIVFRSRDDRVPVPAAPSVSLNAVFGDKIELTGYSLNKNTSPPQLVLYWKSLSPVAQDFTVFVQLRDADNRPVAGWDHQPLQGMYPTRLWQPGEIIADTVALTPPAELPAAYHLAVGLYDLQTLVRLPLQSDTGGENAVYIFEKLW